MKEFFNIIWSESLTNSKRQVFQIMKNILSFCVVFCVDLSDLKWNHSVPPCLKNLFWSVCLNRLLWRWSSKLIIMLLSWSVVLVRIHMRQTRDRFNSQYSDLVYYVLNSLLSFEFFWILLDSLRFLHYLEVLGIRIQKLSGNTEEFRRFQGN